jgi:hypothetical protein
MLEATIADTCAPLRHGVTRATTHHPVSTYPDPPPNIITSVEARKPSSPVSQRAANSLAVKPVDEVQHAAARPLGRWNCADPTGT